MSLPSCGDRGVISVVIESYRHGGDSAVGAKEPAAKPAIPPANPTIPIIPPTFVSVAFLVSIPTAVTANPTAPTSAETCHGLPS